MTKGSVLQEDIIVSEAKTNRISRRNRQITIIVGDCSTSLSVIYRYRCKKTGKDIVEQHYQSTSFN